MSEATKAAIYFGVGLFNLYMAVKLGFKPGTLDKLWVGNLIVACFTLSIALNYALIYMKGKP